MRTSDLSLLVALCGCSIAPADYTGKACADGKCPAGYECNVATNQCQTDVVMIDGAVTSNDDARDADTVAESCLPNPRSGLVYASASFGQLPGGWATSGSWSTSGGELLQMDAAVDHAFAARTIDTAEAGNYRLVATMRALRVTGDRLGIAFRVSPSPDGVMYACVLDTTTGRFELRYAQPGVDATFGSRMLTVGPQEVFTIEVDASGTDLRCCIRGRSGSNISVQNAMLPTGAAGVTTQDSHGAFSSFYAYQ